MPAHGFWQPIETGPKQGTEVLLNYEGSVHEGRYMMKGRDPYQQEGWYWSGFGGGTMTIYNRPSGAVGPIYPSHWMPMPEPPGFAFDGETKHG